MVRERRGFVLGGEGGGLGWFCARQTSVGEQCQLRKMFYEKNLVITSFLQCIFSQQKIFSALTKVLQQNKHLKMLKMYN